MNIIQHTTVNVELISEAFYIPQLDRWRRIWMYYPEDYRQSDKRYPVIYMHDGQNLFDAATAFGEEWCIDETLNSFNAQCIVIGIENSEHRMTEYNCHHHEKYGKGEGKEYIDFIVHHLKPYIDENYRTKPDRENTFMAGSSMGGLVSLFAALYYPEVFGKSGIFSPSLWIVPHFINELTLLANKNFLYKQLFYFYGGANEGCNMVGNLDQVVQLFRQYPLYTVYLEIDQEGEHTEICWRDKFTNFYQWLHV